MAQFDVGNEQAILGSVLSSTEDRRKVCATVPSECFLGPMHRVIYDAVRRCDTEGMEPDLAAISTFAAGQDFGGPELVSQIAAAGNAANLVRHVRILREDYTRHKVRRGVLPKFDALLSDKTADAMECHRAAVEIVKQLRPDRVSTVDNRWREEFNRRCSGEAPSFVSTGFRELDSVLVEGLMPRNLSVVAARPGMGKTSLSIEIAVRHLLSPKPRLRLLVGALEPGRDKWISMAITRITGIPFDRLLKNAADLTIDERRAVDEAYDGVLFPGDDSLVIVEKIKERRSGSRWTNSDSLDRLEQIVGENDAELCIWDLFHIMMSDKSPDGMTNSLYETKEIAKDTKSHHMLLHHISREFEKDKKRSKGQVDRPTLDHLKGSGGWEEVGDLIIFLHREKHYRPHLTNDMIELNVAKQRSGPGNLVFEGRFDGGICRVSEVRPLSVGDHEAAFLSSEAGPF